MEEIRNRVKESGIISLDLGDYKPNTKTFGIDIADQLWQGLALKEKDFRSWVKEHDWNQYASASAYIFCSADAIIPTWAYMLIASELTKVGCISVVGDQIELEKQLILQKIKDDSIEKYMDQRIIIKGCSDIKSPEFAMVELLKHLQPAAKSIMYGEPCSTVPVFKRK
jgi:hypothetical protein